MREQAASKEDVRKRFDSRGGGVRAVLGVLLLLTGCASITHVRPVPRGALVAEASAGGHRFGP